MVGPRGFIGRIQRAAAIPVDTRSAESPLADCFYPNDSLRFHQPGRHKMPLDISVVIPTFRRPKELVEALRSVLGQSGVTLEVTVVDDCPDGSAREPVEHLQDPRVTYFRNPNPTGGVPSIVRNLAWPSAQGKFLHFLDDDDVVPDGLYAEVMQSFARHPDVGLVFGRIEPFGTCPEPQLRHEQRFFAKAEKAARACEWFGKKFAFASRTLFDMPMLVCSGGIMRRECLERVGGFDPQISMVEDSDLYMRVMRECGAHFLPRLSLRYRIGRVSMMHSPERSAADVRRQHDGRRRMQEKYKQKHGSLEFYALALFARTVLRVAIFLSEQPRSFGARRPAMLSQAVR
jgi:GT2 family glycosyltransferase